MEKEFAVCVRASLTVTATNGLQSERETRRAFLVFKEMIATQQLEMTEVQTQRKFTVLTAVCAGQ